MAQSKAVQKKEATNVAVLDTSMFEADADFNTGELGSDDLALPFIDMEGSSDFDVTDKG